MTLGCRCLVLGAVLTVACTKSSIRPSLPMVAFVHAAVIPMDRERVLDDQTVLVIGDSIAAVDSTSKVRLPAGTRVIDATSQYILPGLIDSHVHVETSAFAQALHLPLADSIPFERVLLPYWFTASHPFASCRVRLICWLRGSAYAMERCLDRR